MRILMFAVLAAGLFVLTACGASEDSREFERAAMYTAEMDTMSMAMDATDAYTDESRSFESEIMEESAMASDMATDFYDEEDVAETTALESAPPAPDSSGPIAEPVSQQRMIVRTANVSIQVQDVEASLAEISALASSLGGWTVAVEESLTYSAFIAVRVPAERLDSVLTRLRSMAEEVQQVSVTSRDVTDEYVDNRARLTNLQATAEALRELLAQAKDVEAALKVHATLMGIQSDVERLQGRLKLLEETAAFSLVNVRVFQVPGGLAMDAGPDQTSSMGQVVRFRATFTVPEELDTYSYTWDFGDGSTRAGLSQTAPTADEDVRVTATVTHVYDDDRDSPFIAEIKMKAWGKAGVFEGEDTLTVTVTRRPSIEVFTGEVLDVKAGDEVELTATFTRPADLTTLRYEWDFGDGSMLSDGAVPEGATSVTTSHVYEHHRSRPYSARFTITGDSAAGAVQSSAVTVVIVAEDPGLVLFGWSPMDQGKYAVRALIAIGQALLTALIWAAVLSPLWLVIGGSALFLIRRSKSRAAQNPPPPGAAGE